MLDQAEDPEKLIRLMIREMEETLVELKAACARTMAERRRLERALEAVDAQYALWDKRAELALAANREDLAREALLERRNEAEHKDALQSEMRECEELVTRTQDDMVMLEQKILAAREKQRLLAQRHVHARVRRQAREEAQRSASYDVMRRFEDMERRVEHMEAEAEATRVSRSTAPESFVDLETRDAIERDLEALRERVSGRPS